MLTLQRFKTIRLIIGILVVSFGLSVVFHALDSYAHGGATIQKTVVTITTVQTSNDSSKMLRCPVESCDYY